MLAEKKKSVHINICVTNHRSKNLGIPGGIFKNRRREDKCQNWRRAMPNAGGFSSSAICSTTYTLVELRSGK